MKLIKTEVSFDYHDDFFEVTALLWDRFTYTRWFHNGYVEFIYETN